jgi:polyhydroxyalkanoate synthesis regulator phasin
MSQMTIDDLIRDLILEDQFKAKYTKRQRSIFCKNMYTKISAFLKEKEREELKHADDLEQDVDELEQELQKVRQELHEYKLGYNILFRRTFQYIAVDIFYYTLSISLQIYFSCKVYKYFTWIMQIHQSEKLQEIM